MNLRYSKMKTEKGLILIAHGSRVKKTAEEMQVLVDKVQQKFCDRAVTAAYMEIQPPGLVETVGNMFRQGIKEIDILPLFFFEGRHMRDDIPAQVNECIAEFSTCEIRLLPYIGSTEYFSNALVDSVLSL